MLGNYMLLLALASVNAQYDRQYDNRITDPILTPIINWFDLFNSQQETTQFAHSIDDRNSIRRIPSPILRSFNFYPVTTTTPKPNFLNDFIRPFIEPFQKELKLQKGTKIRQIPSSHNNKQSLSNLLGSIGMNAKPKDELEVGRDKTINIMGMDVGQKDGLMLSPLKGLSLGKQNLFGPVAVHDDYKIGWNFLDNLESIFMPKNK